jgi:cation diffusion facilitator family transporter
VNRTSEIRKILVLILGLNLLVAAAKFGWGVYTGSVSMAADGVQSTLDAAANVVALVGISVAARPPDEEHHYGHQRYETLVSLVIAAMMTFGAVEIVQQAIHRLQSGSSPDVALGSFVVMLATISVNVGVSLWERRKARLLASDLLAADAMHTMSDILVSLGVILGLIGVRLGWHEADALVSLVIAVVIVWAAWTIVRDASLVLTDAVTHDPREIMTAVLATPQVETAHKLRARSAGGHLLVDIDITVDPQMKVQDAHEVASAVERNIKRVAGSDTQALVHVEPAIPPHTRPDRLFGDVQAPLDSRGDEGRQAHGASNPRPGETLRES